jgi:hypothetical protein
MAFNRVIRLEITNKTKTVKISDLNISFDIKRTTGNEANSAVFTIYNAKESTRNDLLTEESTLNFWAGYEDENNTALIFSGTITEAENRKENTEWITEIKATNFAGNQDVFKYTTISVSYKEKTPLVSVIKDLASSLECALSGVNNTSVILDNGFGYTGNVNGLIDMIRKYLLPDCAIYFDNEELIIYKIEGESSFDVVRLTNKSGLISANYKVDNTTKTLKNQVPKNIVLSCLLNPKLKPRAVIDIDGKTVKGLFIIEQIQFSGNNFGGDFLCNIEAVE